MLTGLFSVNKEAFYLVKSPKKWQREVILVGKIFSYRQVMPSRFLYVIFLLFAQTIFAQPKWDSLIYALEKTPPNTEQYGRLLVSICWQISHLDVDSAFYYGEKVWEMDSAVLTDSIRARAYISLSAAYSYKGHHHKAIELSYKGLAISESIKDTMAIIAAANNIGIDFYYLGDFENARSYYERLVDLAIATDDQHQLGNAYNNIGTIEGETGNYEAEREMYRKAIICFKKINAERDYANTLVNISTTLSALEDYEEVREYLKEAKRIFIEFNCIADLADVYSFWAEVELKRGNLDEAEKLILESIQFGEANNQDLFTQFGYKTASDIYEKKHNYKSGICISCKNIIINMLPLGIRKKQKQLRPCVSSMKQHKRSRKLSNWSNKMKSWYYALIKQKKTDYFCCSVFLLLPLSL